MEGESQLHQAAACRLLSKIASLLDEGNDIEVLDDNGQTALHLATENNFGAEVCLLLERGANVNVKDSNGNTPLHFSVLNKNIDIVKKLVSAGSNTEYKDKYGRTPLQLAALSRNWEIFELLLQSKANYNVSDFEGRKPLEVLISQEFNINVNSLCTKKLVNVKNTENVTPIHHAIRKSCANLVEILLEAGADVESQDSSGKSLLHIVTESAFQHVFTVALEQGEEAIYNFYSTLEQNNSELAVRFLLEQGKIELKNKYGESLEVPINPGNKGRIVEVLLKHGANIEAKDSSNETPLLRTVKNYSQYNDDESALQMLLAKGANIFAKDEWGRVPLHYAISTKTICSLLDKGANIEEKDCRGRTALLSAIEMYRDSGQNSTSVINVLLNRGANVNIIDFGGNTPLHSACNNHELVQILLSRGADIEAKDRNGETPLFKAVKCNSLPFINNWQSINLLLEKGADVNTKDSEGTSVLHLPKINNNLFKILVDHGCDVHVKDVNGQTPLHLADSVFKFEELLARGAKFDQTDNNGLTPLQIFISREKMVPPLFSNFEQLHAAKDCNGYTPLHVAVKDSCINFVSKLLEKGASVNLKDNDGETPLHFAAMIFAKRGVEIMEKLLQQEPILDVQNNSGETPLLVSCYSNNAAIAEILMLRGARLDLSDDYGESPLILNPCGTESVRKKLLEHIIKFKTANLKEELKFDLDYYKDIITDNLINIDDLDDLPDLQTFDVTCLRELERMKMNPPLFCIISNYKKKDPSYVSNRSIKDTIDSSSLDSQFPIYSPVLRVKFKEAEKRNELLAMATITLGNIMKTMYLPTEIIRLILSELSNQHLKYLIIDE